MSAPKSSLERYMVGKVYPGTTSKITAINKGKDDARVIHLANGQTLRQSKAKVFGNFKAMLTAEQQPKALRSIRETAAGKFAATIGGAAKGARKVFATQGAAKAAITRHYGKP